MQSPLRRQALLRRHRGYDGWKVEQRPMEPTHHVPTVAGRKARPVRSAERVCQQASRISLTKFCRCNNSRGDISWTTSDWLLSEAPCRRVQKLHSSRAAGLCKRVDDAPRLTVIWIIRECRKMLQQQGQARTPTSFKNRDPDRARATIRARP